MNFPATCCPLRYFLPGFRFSKPLVNTPCPEIALEEGRISPTFAEDTIPSFDVIAPPLFYGSISCLLGWEASRRVTGTHQLAATRYISSLSSMVRDNTGSLDSCHVNSRSSTGSKSDFRSLHYCCDFSTIWVAGFKPGPSSAMIRHLAATTICTREDGMAVADVGEIRVSSFPLNPCERHKWRCIWCLVLTAFKKTRFLWETAISSPGGTPTSLSAWEVTGGRWRIGTRLPILFYRFMGAKVREHPNLGGIVRKQHGALLSPIPSGDKSAFKNRFAQQESTSCWRDTLLRTTKRGRKKTPNSILLVSTSKPPPVRFRF